MAKLVGRRSVYLNTTQTQLESEKGRLTGSSAIAGANEAQRTLLVCRGTGA